MIKQGEGSLRILVVSDTHGDAASLREAVLAQPKAEAVIHLGDGGHDLDNLRNSFPGKIFLQVRGNCDWGSSLPLTEDFVWNGVRVFCTHGHYYQVKYGTYDLISAAESRKADIVLYGHTHVPETRYEDGLYIMNPGSLHGYDAAYGVIDITDRGIVLNIIQLNKR